MLKLNKLQSSGKKRKRVGRGGARGGSSGRGFGGQKARSGAGVGQLFEGGQMPLIRRLPKRGFSNAPFAHEYDIINLAQLENHFDNDATVTYDALRESRLVRGARKHIKILANGELNKKLTVHAHRFSAKAREMIQKVGGQAILIQES